MSAGSSGVALDAVVGAAGYGARVQGDGSVRCTGVTHDSRRVEPGWLFCCVPGATVDGHDFAETAVRRGAAALLVDHPLTDRAVLGTPQLVVGSVRDAMGPVAAAIHGHPARRLTMVGVTGTNGKTTVTQMIATVLRATGRHPGVIGTLTGTHTTPEAPDLQRRLAELADSGHDAVVMEVSSHALALRRVDGARFDVAVFTNLGRDHLDLHGTVERYFAAKALLFRAGLAERGVVNLDDRHGRLIADAADIPVVGYRRADASEVEVSAERMRFTWRGQRLDVPLGGDFNVDNALAAATACAELGVAEAEIAAALATLDPVPGRFEAVRAGQDFDVIVDFAHTPDGLHASLAAARRAARERVVVVFGAGGDRDPDKRPLMGAAAAAWADVIVVTSDNPRSEDPQAIIDAIRSGIPGDYPGQVVTQPDRRRAFIEACAVARPGDVVVIAGKGHETTQTIGNTVYEFDDRAVAHEVLRQQLEAAR